MLRYFKSVYGLTGAAFIVLGVILLLRTLNIATLRLPVAVLQFWPVAVIAVGVVLLLNKKVLALLLTFLFVIIGLLFVLDYVFAGISGAPRTVSDEVLIADFESLDFSIGFGEGSLMLSNTSRDAVRYTATTQSRSDPRLVMRAIDTMANVVLSRDLSNSVIVQDLEEEWAVQIPKIPAHVSAAYGEGEATFDLTGLEVAELSLDTSSSITDITFDTFPTEVEMIAHDSEIVLRFPKNIDVRVKTTGANVDTQFDGFDDERGYFVNPGYRAFDDRITVKITASDSVVRGVFYGEDEETV